MISADEVDRLYDAGVRGADAQKIGGVSRVYLDDQTGAPAWVTVKTGLFGSHESFVPVAEATFDGEEHTLYVPYTKDQVRDAPRTDPETELTPAEEDALYAHYGLPAATAERAEPASDDAPAPADDDAEPRAPAEETYAPRDYASPHENYAVPEQTFPPPDHAAAAATASPAGDDSITRLEERLSVDTEQHESGRVRLRKYVVTEQQTITVPVRREEVRLERVPIGEEDDSAAEGYEIGEAEYEIVLHEERPVVTTEVHAVERVRLSTEQVTESETVTGEVRKERFQLDDSGSDRPDEGLER